MNHGTFAVAFAFLVFFPVGLLVLFLLLLGLKLKMIGEKDAIIYGLVALVLFALGAFWLQGYFKKVFESSAKKAETAAFERKPKKKWGREKF